MWIQGNKFITKPDGAGEIPILYSAPNKAFSPDQDWLQFDGGLSIAFGGTKQSISHKIRSPR